MPKEDWINNSIENVFKRENLWLDCKISSVLDVACGLSLKSQYISADIRVGIDIYRPYLERIEANVPFIAINEDIMKIDKIFLSNSFDIVLLLDIIEHLDKEDSLKLIKMAEDIARKAVIIETPKGYIPQNMDIWGFGGDEFQTHRCGWEPKELQNIGYEIVIRDYVMSDVKRHTEIHVDKNVQLIDAIKRL